MACAACSTPRASSDRLCLCIWQSRFGLKDTQMRNGHAQYQQQQQHFPYGVGSEAFWDPISEPQSFKFNSNYSSGGGQQLQQQQQHRQDQ